MKLITIVVLFFVYILTIPSVSFGDTSHHKQVKCPVTGTMIDPSKAFSQTTYKGKTYYFCCVDCVGKFKQNPRVFIK